MATYIKTLKEDNGDIVYPQTITNAIYTSGGETLETRISKYVTAEDIAQSVASFGTVTGGMIADSTISTSKVVLSSFIDLFYPVGSYYETSDTSFDPNVSWTGTWVEDSAGRVLVAKDSGTFATVGDTGGEETHTLILNEIPSHGHEVSRYNNTEGFSTAYGNPCTGWCLRSNLTGSQNDILTTNKGGGLAHNNLQPYVVVKRWHRTA